MITTHLKSVRERRGIAAADLATQTGVARQTIYAIESGSFVPNTTVALQLARALEVSVEELFAMSDDELAEPRNIDAVLLDELEATTEGLPVRLCCVGSRVIAAPIRIAPSWLPGANSVIASRRSAATVSARLLDSEEDLKRNILVAGCDPAISVLSRFLISSEGVDVAAVECSSLRALQLLKNGKAHIAGMHLRDAKTGEFNIPFVRKAFPRGGFQVIGYGKWEQGFVVAPGNPLEIRSAEDLARRNVKIMNREAGAGSRELLDRLLRESGIDPARVQGYERTAPGHLSAAQAVLTGQADCCVATRNAALSFGLGFVPLTEERYDFVTLGNFVNEPPVKAFLDVLSRGKLRKELASIAGYDTTETGSLRV